MSLLIILFCCTCPHTDIRETHCKCKRFVQLRSTTRKKMFGKVWVSKWLWGMFGDDINGRKGLGNVWVVTSCISDKKINNRIPVCENPKPKIYQTFRMRAKSAPGLTQHPQQTLRVNRMHRRKIGFIEGQQQGVFVNVQQVLVGSHQQWNSRLRCLRQNFSVVLFGFGNE